MKGKTMLARKRFTVLLVVALLKSAAVWAADTTEPITAILGAQTREIAALREESSGLKERKIMGISFWEGRLAGRRAVIARMSGGKVNAALAATLTVEHFRPSEVIVTGIAGGLNPELKVGDLVIARQTVQHDMVRLQASGIEHRGARHPVSGRRNPVFFEPPARLLEIARRAATQIPFLPIGLEDGGPTSHSVRVVSGIVATGDAFVASDGKRKELRDLLKADAVEMEGAAVAQICFQFGVPCIVIRCLSDTADQTAVEDLEQFADIAAINSARLVYGICKLLAEGEKTPNPKE